MRRSAAALLASPAAPIRKDNNHADLSRFREFTPVNHHRPDPWKAVAARTQWLLSTASTKDDPRGAFVGLALRPPPEGNADPVAMELALHNDEFGIELVSLLAKWGIVR